MDDCACAVCYVHVGFFLVSVAEYREFCWVGFDFVDEVYYDSVG